MVIIITLMATLVNNPMQGLVAFPVAGNINSGHLVKVGSASFSSVKVPPHLGTHEYVWGMSFETV